MLHSKYTWWIITVSTILVIETIKNRMHPTEQCLMEIPAVDQSSQYKEHQAIPIKAWIIFITLEDKAKISTKMVLQWCMKITTRTLTEWSKELTFTHRPSLNLISRWMDNKLIILRQTILWTSLRVFRRMVSRRGCYHLPNSSNRCHTSLLKSTEVWITPISFKQAAWKVQLNSWTKVVCYLDNKARFSVVPQGSSNRTLAVEETLPWQQVALLQTTSPPNRWVHNTFLKIQTNNQILKAIQIFRNISCQINWKWNKAKEASYHFQTMKIHKWTRKPKTRLKQRIGLSMRDSSWNNIIRKTWQMLRKE